MLGAVFSRNFRCKSPAFAKPFPVICNSIKTASMNQFPKNVIENLKNYVYIYSDPITEKIFYVGKGKGNRVFDHLKAR